MVKKYKRGDRTKLSAHFQACEFDCHGGECSETLIDEELVEDLEIIRVHFDEPVNISSGYRCPTWNANPSVGGATNSFHTKGQAADIYLKNATPLQVAQYAQSLGFRGIGLYDTFVHIDTRANKCFWKNNAETGHKETVVQTFGTSTLNNTTKPSNNLKDIVAQLKSLINELEAKI